MSTTAQWISSLEGREPLFFFDIPRLVRDLGGDPDTLPFSVKILLESVARHQSHPAFNEGHIRALALWQPMGEQQEIPFLPARVLLQDFTGVPCIADLAALRAAVARAGRDPASIEPLIPVDLVIDHSVQLDRSGTEDALEFNLRREFERNIERYRFLRWGQSAFRRLRIVPPGVGICHQVNLEYLATVVATTVLEGRKFALPDSVVGTDSHTTMINGAGVLGWGVGGIEAEAAMLGQPMPVLTPRVTGVRLTGALPPGATATDLALTLTEALRKLNVVDQFVEFSGPGLKNLTLADRATVANMAPEYGATMGFFPVDEETVRYLLETGRSPDHAAQVEAYCRRQGLWHLPEVSPVYSRTIEFDLGQVEPSIAGPKRPHDRTSLSQVKNRFRAALINPDKGYGVPEERASETVMLEGRGRIGHGSIVLASITSCTNTSNPHLMLAAGLVARKAVERGLRVPPYVKTSLAPGSRVVTAYLRRTGLLAALEQLGFHVAAYGCATCIGNSGPLDPLVENAVTERGLVVAAVLSGNRNFEARVHPMVRANYLCSPPLVIAYALAGRIDVDLSAEPVGHDAAGQPVYLRDIWPTSEEIRALLDSAMRPELYHELYRNVAEDNPRWNALQAESAPVYAWDPNSTYIREPPFVADIPLEPAPLQDIEGARILAIFGDFITTDHISPAGAISADSPAGRYLLEHGVTPEDFNSYGARRGNHEVMVRGAFANVRVRNRMVAREGGWTIHWPEGALLSIYEAAERYRQEGVPLVVLAGQMYGAGSSRDWAAKGTRMLGVRAVIAQSFERIHRSNLVGMGVLPLEWEGGQNAETLGLTGRELIAIRGIAERLEPGAWLVAVATRPDGTQQEFRVRCRIDSLTELEYYRHGGILPFVLRQALRGRIS